MPRFIDRDEMRQHIEGKFVALVGSGPSVLHNPAGFIDSHEVVIRVNNYKLTGPLTGKRTDIHYSFYGTSVRKRVDELKRDGVRLCICKCPNAQFMESEWHTKNGKMRGVDFRYIYEERRNWWFCDTYVPTVAEFVQSFDLLGGHVPTTGFAALLDVLSCNPANVYMTGYDFFQSRIHNVHERWRPNNPDDPIGHVPDGEREWFATHVENLPVTMDEALNKALSRKLRSSSRVQFHPRRAA